MNLPFLSKKQADKNFFLSLLVRPYKVGAILFEEVNNKLVILANNEVDIESDIDQITEEELLVAADKTISTVEQNLPEGESVTKTIFSLPYDWIEENKIKGTYLDKLKGVCKALDLTPIGYLTSIEAIVHFIDKNEGAPVSAVFLEITKSRVFSYIVRAGKVVEASSETISDGPLGASETLLKKVTSVDVLPAKIILLDLENSSKIQQEFLSNKWNSGIPFMHVPQVVVLEKGFENEAVVNGVATQMELQIATDVKAAEEEVISSPLEEAEGEDFGFVKEADVADASEEKITTKTEKDVETKSEDFENVGNVTPISGKNDLDVNYFKENEEEIEEEAFPKESKLPIAFNFAVITDFIKKIKIPSNIKMPNLKEGPKNKILIVPIGIILFLLVFGYIYYNFILGVTVSVFSDRKAVDKTTQINFAEDPSGDNSIKLTIVQEEVKGSEEKNATGKKETGDKAKGSVVIYNKTEEPKSFNKGATVIGPNSLEFVLTDDVKVASTSSFATSLSSASVKIEAAKFGKEYNIPSGSNFTVKGFSTSDFIAKNSDATSGGSSKTTTVVSKKDLSDLRSLITQKLTSDAISKAQSEASDDESVLPDPLSADVSDESYSKKENQEASSVSLSATIVYDVGKYNKRDIDEVVKKMSKNEVPESFVLQQSDSKVEVENIKVSSDGQSASATLKINAVYSPQMDTFSLAKKLTGKSNEAAEKQLRDITGVTDVTILYKRKLPLFPNLLPFNNKNIQVEIKH